MAGNDRKPENGTEAASRFLALKRQRLEGEPGVDLKSQSFELAQTVIKVGTGSSGRLEEHRGHMEERSA